MLAMTTDEVLDALGRYTKDSKESDRQTATKLGIRRSVLWDWLRGGIQPEKCALARLAGFLKRVGYL
jgi:transcriptional regulator with XRE-family HTH domain